jgi:Ca-activated chloride channel family protein
MTTQNRDSTNPSYSHDGAPNQQAARRRSWLMAGLLLIATLAFGAATQDNPLRSGGGGSATIQPTGTGESVSLHGNLDRTAVMLGSDGLVRMELVMQAERRAGSQFSRLPTDLVIVLDRSGSMGGQKIADARTAVRQLISQLGPDDRFSLVTFSSGSRLAIPLSHATPRAVASWHRTINSIDSGGGTYMGPALDLAFNAIDAARVASRAPRAILISDGLASEPHSELRDKALRASLGEYALSTVGVGSDFDEELMSLLSDAGTGNYYYLVDMENLAQIFSNEFETANETVASGLDVRIVPAPGVTVVEASGYPLEQNGSAVEFRPGSLYSNQRRHVWVTFRVPTDTPRQTALGTVQLSYTEDGSAKQLDLGELPEIACVEEQKDFFANLDVDRWAKSVVVEEYNDLAEQVAAHVKSGRKGDAERAVREFRARNQALNRVAASPRVAVQLDQTRELEASIDDAFAGADQEKKQNLLGKSLHSRSYEMRREGSRK